MTMRKEDGDLSSNLKKNSAESSKFSESTCQIGDSLIDMTNNHMISINKSRNKTSFGTNKSKTGLKLSSAQTEIGLNLSI